MGRVERIVVAIFGIIVAVIVAYGFFNMFLEKGVEPNVAGGLALAIFLAVLGAF